jgi:hypothetical protein
MFDIMMAPVSQYFVPQINMKLDRLQLRFTNPDLGNITPTCRVQIFEDNNVIGEVTKTFTLPAFEGLLVEFVFNNSLNLRADTQYRVRVSLYGDFFGSLAVDIRRPAALPPPNAPDVPVGLNAVLGDLVLHFMGGDSRPIDRLYFLGYGELEQIEPVIAEFSAGLSVGAVFNRRRGCLRSVAAVLSFGAGFGRAGSYVRCWVAKTSLWLTLSRQFRALRQFSVALNAAANLSRFSSVLRKWVNTVSLHSSLSRQFSAVRQFSAGLKVAVDLSRFVSVLRGWSSGFSLHSALSRQFNVFRGFTAKLGVAALLSQLSGVVHEFSAHLSLSASFEMFRLPALREVTFSAGLSVKSAFSRSAELSRRLLGFLGVFGGFRRLLSSVRGFSVLARLVVLFEALRFSVLREVAFNAGVSLVAVLQRRVVSFRQILTNLDVSAGLYRWVLGVRGWAAKVVVFAGVERCIVLVRRFYAKLGVSAGFGRVFCVLRGFRADFNVSALFGRGFVFVRGLAGSLRLGVWFDRVFGRVRNALHLFERRKHSDIVEETP